MKRCHERLERPQDFQLECRVKNITINMIIVVHLFIQWKYKQLCSKLAKLARAKTKKVRRTMHIRISNIYVDDMNLLDVSKRIMNDMRAPLHVFPKKFE